MKKTIAIYQDAMIDVEDHLRYPSLYKTPNKLSATFILYEETYRPLKHLFRLTTERKYQVFGEKAGKDYFHYLVEYSDIYTMLISPWLLGSDLKFLEASLKEYREKIWPKNDFIYKDYEEPKASS